jgi:leucyl-tRNA synthetase
MAEQTDRPRKYDFKSVESKWQTFWDERKLFEAPPHPGDADKFYLLVMFAYPSGDIHMGHFRNYIIGDAVARQQMMLGKQVIHPYGWDAFGLPAERAAIKRNIHPSVWTKQNIGISGNTLKKTGVSFDWSREIASCDPEYYKFTQWMFVELFKKGLAYRQRGFVNWCPEDKTVLANEQVVDGKCERCGTLVEKKEQVQWYFKITDYADRLIDDLDDLPDWPDNVKTMQREWIGRSYGLEVDFTIESTGEKLPIFTTRPDTIYGVTFMAIAPESEIIAQLGMDAEHTAAVDTYKREVAGRSDIDRAAITDDKDGVFTGKYAINPYNGERVQLWVADYVLSGYGTGAVMAVPAHDTRDFAFARKYDIPIRVVIHPDAETSLEAAAMTEAFTEKGPMVSSGQFDGKSGKVAIDAVSDYAESEKFGRRRVNFKLKDWSISRQRYWGCPIPIIHCPKCGEVAVPHDQLPVELPVVEDYHPKGRSPLADVESFMNTTCPKCGGEAQRDADTMDTFVCSSWYYLRYLDPFNETEPFDSDKANAWLPIDLYIGGISHATGHLLYFRFFHKFLQDIGWLNSSEPAKRLFNHGMVADAQGEVMSKSKGNVVSPMTLFDDYGVDVARLAMFFAAPSDRPIGWDTKEFITGPDKFVYSRLYPIVEHFRACGCDLKYRFKNDELSPGDRKLYVKLNQTIKRVSESFERLQFNTAISALMELVRDFEAAKVQNDQLNDAVILKTIQQIAPLAPHLAEEMWQKCGFDTSVFKSSWPVHDPDAVVGDSVEIAVQVNGKLRGTVMVPVGSEQAPVEEAAKQHEKVQGYLAGKQIFKVIYVPGRLISFVVKG